MKGRLVVAALLLAVPAAAEEFQPSRQMVRTARYAMELQQNGDIDDALDIISDDDRCKVEPLRLRCREYMLFVAGYIQEREAWRAPPEQRDRWLDAALASYRAVLETFPTPSTWANIGAIHTARRRYEEALAAFRRAEALAPGGCIEECALAYGDALERSGNPDAAAVAYRRADETLGGTDAARRLLALLGTLACRDARLEHADELLALALRLVSVDPFRTRNALECLMSAAGPDHPSAATAAVRWLEVSTGVEEEMILRTLPPRAAAELKLLLLGGADEANAAWWTANAERRRTAARYLLVRARQEAAQRGLALAETARRIAPEVDADPTGAAETPLRAAAAIELLYRHATAPDDRAAIIGGIATTSLDELERAERRRCAGCVAQIAAIAAATHLQRHRYGEAVAFLERASRVTWRWQRPQPHVHLLLAEAYGAMLDGTAQRQQLVAATMAYLDQANPLGARRALDLAAAAGVTDDDILLLRNITAARMLLADRRRVYRDDVEDLPTFHWVWRSAKTSLPDEFIVRQRQAVRASVADPPAYTAFQPGEALSDTITVTSSLPSLSQRQASAEAVQPISPVSFSLATFGDATSARPIPVPGLTISEATVTPRLNDLWEVSAYYSVMPPAADDPLATTPRGGERERLTLNGPLLPERLWLFGSYQAIDSNQNAVGGQPNDLESHDFSARLTYIPTHAVTVVANGERDITAELNAGASPSRTPSARQDARRSRSDLKLASTLLLGGWVTTTGTIQRTRWSWKRDAVSGAAPFLDAAGFWNENVSTRDRQTADNVALDASAFLGDVVFSTIKGGFTIQRWSDTTDRFSDFDFMTVDGANVDATVLVSPALPAPGYEEYWRSGNTSTRRTARTVWLHDEVNTQLGTIAALVQHTSWSGRADAVSLAANRAAPELLPAIDAPAADPVEWSAFAYQLAGRYSRVSYFSAEATVSRTPSPLTPLLLAFGQLDAHDVVRTNGFVGRGIDPRSPGVTSHVIDSRLRPELSDTATITLAWRSIYGSTITLGGEYRRDRDVVELRPLIRDAQGMVRPALASEYELQDSQAPQVWFVPPQTGTLTGGALLTNGDRERRLAAATVTLATEWGRLRLKATGTARRHRWDIGPEYRRFDDPTETAQTISSAGFFDADVEEEVAESFYGTDPRALAYSSARWSAAGSTLYVRELGAYGVGVLTELRLRDGDVRPSYTTARAYDGRIVRVRTPGRNEHYPSWRELNAGLRVERQLWGGWAWAEARGLNLLDERTELRRIHDLRSPRAGALEETALGRSFELRVGVRW